MNRKFFFTITILFLNLCVWLNASANGWNGGDWELPKSPLRITRVVITIVEKGSGYVEFNEDGQVIDGSNRFVLIKTSDQPKFTVRVKTIETQGGKSPIEKHANGEEVLSSGKEVVVSSGSNSIKIEAIDAEGDQVSLQCPIEVTPYSLSSWGRMGMEPEDFGHRLGRYRKKIDDPADITIDTDGYVYTASPANLCIQKFTWDGQLVTSWKNGDFIGDRDDYRDACLASDAAGHIYVLDYKGVKKYSTSGDLVASWTFAAIGLGHDIAADLNGFYLFSESDPGVRHFDSQGELLKQWKLEEDPSDIHIPSIDVDISGNIYISHGWQELIGKDDYGNKTYKSYNELTKYDSNGTVLKHFEAKYDTKAFDVAPDGNIYRYDTGGYLCVYDKAGQRLYDHELDNVEAQIGGPWHVGYLGGRLAVSKNGTIFWADASNHRVMVLRPGEDKEM